MKNFLFSIFALVAITASCATQTTKEYVDKKDGETVTALKTYTDEKVGEVRESIALDFLPGSWTNGQSIVAGFGASASGGVNTVIGSGSVADGVGATAFGEASRAIGNHASAWGSARALADYCIAMGLDAEAAAAYSIAVGAGAMSSNQLAIAIGTSSKASGLVSTSIGYLSNASSNHTLAVGAQANATGFQSGAIGAGNQANGPNSYAIGFSNLASGENSIAVGTTSMATDYKAAVVGNNSVAGSSLSTVIGSNSRALGMSSAVVGSSSKVYSQLSVAIGEDVLVSNGMQSVAIGTGPRGDMITGATVYGRNSVAVGGYIETNAKYSVSVGYNSIVTNKASIVISAVENAKRGETYFGSHGDGTITLGIKSSDANKVFIGDKTLTSIISEAGGGVPNVTDSTVSGWGYIKSWTETDPTIPAWAKATSKPTYTAAEVGARPDDWMPTAADVHARPNDWMPTAADVGALEKEWQDESYGPSVVIEKRTYLNVTSHLFKVTETPGPGSRTIYSWYADGFTVPWSRVTGAPAIPTTEGGATNITDGVTSGTYNDETRTANIRPLLGYTNYALSGTNQTLALDRSVQYVSISGTNALKILAPMRVYNKARDFLVYINAAGTNALDLTELTGIYATDASATNAVTKGMTMLMFTELTTNTWVIGRQTLNALK